MLVVDRETMQCVRCTSVVCKALLPLPLFVQAGPVIDAGGLFAFARKGAERVLCNEGARCCVSGERFLREFGAPNSLLRTVQRE